MTYDYLEMLTKRRRWTYFTTRKMLITDGFRPSVMAIIRW